MSGDRHLKLAFYEDDDKRQEYMVPLTWRLYGAISEAGIDAVQLACAPQKIAGTQIVTILQLALIEAGCEMDSDAIAEAIVGHGILAYAEDVARLLVGLAMGGGANKIRRGGASPKQKPSRHKSK